MRVSIDHDRCSGHGRCYVLAPELFVDDDEGYGQVIGGGGAVAPDHVDAARKAAQSCPERAVILEED